MSELVRKQIYISKRQEQILKRLSKARGVSEAEIIRNAIDREASGENASQKLVGAQSSGLADFIQLARKNRGLTGEPMPWKRSELYAERENRWLRQVSEGDEDGARPD